MSQQIYFRAILTLILFCAGCSRDEPLMFAPSEHFTVINGHANTTLTADKSPYLVSNTLIVDTLNTLIVEAGVRLYFEDSTQLIVRGGLFCLGTSDQPILFTSKKASWKGIQITNTTIQSILQFTTIEHIDITLQYDTLRDGAVEVRNADVVIHNSIFINNKSMNGGALILDHSRSVIMNNLFSNNYAAVYGGAIISSSSSNSIVNNTFYKNNSFNYGGGLLLVSPILDSVQNNIFYANTNTTGNPSIALLQTDSAHYMTAYNFLQGNIDPLFVSTVDLHLSATSPCINAGNPLIQYNDFNGSRCDQGAYGGPNGNW